MLPGVHAWGADRPDAKKRPAEPNPPAARKAGAQAAEPDAGLLAYAELRAFRWRVKLTLRPVDVAVRNVTAYFGVPIAWPEQALELVDETRSPGVRTRERAVDGVGSVVIVNAARIAAGGAATVERVYDVRRSSVTLQSKADPNDFTLPARAPADVRAHLGVSPGIETTAPQIRELAKKVHAGQKRPWAIARRSYDWVREHVRYEMGEYRGAMGALEKGVGDCEDMTALFVALCRSAGIPARSVWVEDHVYPEFYLQAPGKGNDTAGGCWIPAQAAGREQFGRMSDVRVILQKGDRVDDPFRAKPARYLPDSVRAIGGRVTITCERAPVKPSKKA